MSTRKRYTLLLIPLLACCGRGDDEASRTGPLDFSLMSDSAKVLLIDEIPIGSTATQVRERIPTLPPLKRYVTDRLQQTTMPVNLFDRTTELTFNFEDSVLYGYYYDGTLCWPTAQAESLFEVITRFFASRHGQFTHNEEADDLHDMISRQWEEPEGFEATLGMTPREGSNCLGWGYQRPTP